MDKQPSLLQVIRHHIWLWINPPDTHKPTELEMERNRSELLAEDIEALHLCLDDAGVPRSDEDGAVFSLWGRVQKYKHGA